MKSLEFGSSGLHHNGEHITGNSALHQLGSDLCGLVPPWVRFLELALDQELGRRSLWNNFPDKLWEIPWKLVSAASEELTGPLNVTNLAATPRLPQKGSLPNQHTQTCSNLRLSLTPRHIRRHGTALAMAAYIGLNGARRDLWI